VITRMTAVAALVLAAACGGSAPPDDGPAPQGPGGAGEPGMRAGIGGGPPSVFALIGAREQLGLSGAQVTELDSIGRMWSVRNDSLQRQLAELDGRRNATTMDRARPILLRMAENNQRAGRAVETLLNEEQRRIACTLPNAQGERRVSPGRAPGAGPGGRGPGGRGGMRPGGPGGGEPGMRTRWPWCAPAVPADSAAR
jgi:hypothetical protein